LYRATQVELLIGAEVFEVEVPELDAERVTVLVMVTVEGFATLCEFVTVTVLVVTRVTGLQTVEEDLEEERVVV
jgi:hypothetical protein